MTDKPISFSGPMVRALLEGRKTQTRRMVLSAEEIAKGPWTGRAHHSVENGWQVSLERFNARRGVRVPYAVGDRLYVREGWRVQEIFDGYSPVSSKKGNPILQPDRCALRYEADGGREEWVGKYRQAMHMPRWASRLYLVVTEVRVQRLQDISEADCLAEGLQVMTEGDADGDGRPVLFTYYRGADALEWVQDPAEAYFALLDHLHEPGFSDSNPWMAAYSFTVHPGNIDAA